MASLQIQRNLRPEEGRRGDGALTRCPHCDKHFYSGGGEVDSSQERRDEIGRNLRDAREDDDAGDVVPDPRLRRDPDVSERLREEEARPGIRPQNFAKGGKVRHGTPSDSDANSVTVGGAQHRTVRGVKADMGWLGEPPTRAQADRYETHRASVIARNGDEDSRDHFASGGRVDGAGKVDGIHLHPSECSHLASGGVCRHLPPSRRRPAGEDYADHDVHALADGGEVETFERHLAKRRAIRGSRRREE